LGILPVARTSTGHDAIGEFIEKLARPWIQFPGILEEDSNVIGSLLEV
jgi:hypothetical protein